MVERKGNPSVHGDATGELGANIVRERKTFLFQRL
jgi:hypothetical protein